jgi:hypothetical protein
MVAMPTRQFPDEVETRGYGHSCPASASESIYTPLPFPLPGQTLKHWCADERIYFEYL